MALGQKNKMRRQVATVRMAIIKMLDHVDGFTLPQVGAGIDWNLRSATVPRIVAKAADKLVAEGALKVSFANPNRPLYKATPEGVTTLLGLVNPPSKNKAKAFEQIQALFDREEGGEDADV